MDLAVLGGNESKQACGVDSGYIDLTPKAQSPMRRTVSIDLVLVIEVKIELELDLEEKKLLSQGLS
ncbi:hypothetical protein N7453_002894 [Penicillium expansum]|nr:hypothetical protein N7453_002894 [Penicillium expansum]